MPMTQRFLDAILDTYVERGITVAHEIGLAFAPKCHERASMTARYFSGVVTLECTRCRTIIAELAIAKDEETR